MPKEMVLETSQTKAGKFNRCSAVLIAVATAVIAVGAWAGSTDVWRVFPDLGVPEKNGAPVEGLESMSGPKQIEWVLSRLTNGGGDTIFVEPGTYDFAGIAMEVENSGVTNHLCAGDNGFTIVGDTTGHWDDRVVFKGDGRCVRANFWKHVKIYNITFDGFNGGASSGAQGGALKLRSDTSIQAVSNCVFRGCHAYDGGAAFGGAFVDCLFTGCVSKANGGALYAVNGISGCKFESNRSGGSGGAVYGAALADGSIFLDNVSGKDGGAVYVENSTVSNCEFRSNISLRHGGALRGGWEKSVNILNCVFDANVVSNGAGGAVYLDKSTGGIVRGCTFSKNMTVSNDVANTKWQGGAISSGADYDNSAYPAIDVRDCTFTGNFGGNAGGAVANGNCSNCVFVSNRALRFGAGICRGSAMDCTFINNIRDDPRGIDTYHHTEYGGNDAYGARLLRCDMDGGCYSECSLEACRIHDVTNSRTAGVFWGRNWATNCLVTAGSAAGLSLGMFFRYQNRPAETSVVVNCTFADNELSDVGMYHAPSGMTENNYLFLNCIFYNNTYNDTAADLRGPRISVGPVYSNCLFGASSYSSMVGWKDAGGNMMGVNPKFVGEEKAALLAVDPYSPRWASPVIGKGDARCFSGDSADLAGNSRLRDGILDLGCFQCYMPLVGMVILVR